MGYYQGSRNFVSTERKVNKFTINQLSKSLVNTKVEK